MPRKVENVPDRFWSKVDVGIPIVCWPYMGQRLPKGYGLFYANGRKGLAHRFVVEMEHGPIPAGMLVCHHCDNPSCVNPNHLYLGTQVQNIADMFRRGRAPTAEYRSAVGLKVARRGTDHHNSKLDADKVRAIRVTVGSSSEVAKIFGVSRRTIGFIRQGLIWKHVL